jgi:hypothetical protein
MRPIGIGNGYDLYSKAGIVRRYEFHLVAKVSVGNYAKGFGNDFGEHGALRLPPCNKNNTQGLTRRDIHFVKCISLGFMVLY